MALLLEHGFAGSVEAVAVEYIVNDEPVEFTQVYLQLHDHLVL